MEDLRGSRSDGVPSARGLPPIQGLWEDAAAARYRHVLLLAGDIEMQMDLVVISIFVVFFSAYLL